MSGTYVNLLYHIIFSSSKAPCGVRRTLYLGITAPASGRLLFFPNPALARLRASASPGQSRATKPDHFVVDKMYKLQCGAEGPLLRIQAIREC